MEHAQYVRGIKTALKARDISYSDLAQYLKMTESGVKKMLNAKDMSFRRVLQICEMLGITPGQLFSLSERTFISEVQLSPSQEEALLKNRTLLAVYWRLAIEGYEAHEISSLQNLSKAEVQKYLDRLVSLDLLSVKRGVYRPLHSGKFKWSDESKLARTLNKEWSELTLFRSLEKGASGVHRLAAMKLSEKSYAQLSGALHKAIDEAIRDSEREELTLQHRKLQNYMVLVAMTPKGVFDI